MYVNEAPQTGVFKNDWLSKVLLNQVSECFLAKSVAVRVSIAETDQYNSGNESVIIRS